MACKAACSRSARTGSRGTSSKDWFQWWRSGRSISKNSCWNGSNGVSPCTGPWSNTWATCNCATRARLRTVWCWNNALAVKWIPAARARLTTWIEMIESPPRSKKLSFKPTCSTPSTSAQIAAICCSRALCGAS
ncbi:hypothetical protein FX984_06379 [Pseudomonas marginalis]|nr:hypothetical protein FX984_06379 [Pseudomonas marginalis]